MAWRMSTSDIIKPNDIRWAYLMPKTALDLVLACNWAILPDALETIVSIAKREHEFAGKPEGLAAKLGRPLGNTMRATVRDGVALVPVEGPLFRRANLMTEYSGATSYDILAQDFTAAVNDPMVNAVLLVVDSPGGEVNGTSELAAMIRQARDSSGKPIDAYISGTGASAAYWLSSAARKVYASDTAIVGSIGVQSGYTIRDAKTGERTVRFVSSQSPLKNADPESEAGAQQIQQMVDGLAQVFVSTVAENRGISTEKVLSDYGKGGVYVAAKAQEQGMIDGISTLEAVISSLQKESSDMDYSQLTATLIAENRPDLAAEFRKEGASAVDTAAIAAAERERITSIMAAGEGLSGVEAIISAAISDPSKTAATVALDLLKHVKTAAAAPVAPAATTPAAQHMQTLAETEANLIPPQPVDTTADISEIEREKAELEALRKQGVIR